MRDHLSNLLFVVIGTSTDWERYNKFVKERENFKKQLTGFFVEPINLAHLSVEEGAQALEGFMQRFWVEEKIIPPEPAYPFSRDFFRYLLNICMKDLRDVMNALTRIWHKFKEIGVVPLKDPFNMIQFYRSFKN